MTRLEEAYTRACEEQKVRGGFMSPELADLLFLVAERLIQAERMGLFRERDEGPTDLG